MALYKFAYLLTYLGVLRRNLGAARAPSGPTWIRHCLAACSVHRRRVWCYTMRSWCRRWLCTRSLPAVTRVRGGCCCSDGGTNSWWRAMIGLVCISLTQTLVFVWRLSIILFRSFFLRRKFRTDISADITAVNWACIQFCCMSYRVGVCRKSQKFGGSMAPSPWDRGRAWSPMNTPLPTCCHADFGRSRSNGTSVPVYEGCQKKIGPPFKVNQGHAKW